MPSQPKLQHNSRTQENSNGLWKPGTCHLPTTKQRHLQTGNATSSYWCPRVQRSRSQTEKFAPKSSDSGRAKLTKIECVESATCGVRKDGVLGQASSQPRRLIQGGSRMRKSVCTVLCGGQSVMIVPTASLENRWLLNRLCNIGLVRLATVIPEQITLLRPHQGVWSIQANRCDPGTELSILFPGPFSPADSALC
jgi:hypothetical protein